MAEIGQQQRHGTRTAGDPAPRVSVVVPLYNEVENVRPLYDALRYALDGTGRTYEVLFIDDGSDDGTREVLRALAAEHPQLRAILFRRNYGQTAAMAAGFDRARGAVVVTLDGDLQNDPADIPRLLDELDRGFDIVCGWRRHRKDRFATRLLPSRIANKMISWTTGVRIHDTGCSLKAYRAWVVRSLDLYSDMHRFIAALAAGVGARVSEVPVRHHARQFGRSKYGLGRVFRVLVDLLAIKMLIQFSHHPIRWFTLLAMPLFVAAPLLATMGFLKFDGREVVGAAFDTFYATAAAVASIVAFNVFLLGFLAELQLNVSGTFRSKMAITAREAAR